MTAPFWVWQQPDWPDFRWNEAQLAPVLRSCVEAQGRLSGRVGAVDELDESENILDTLLQNIVTSSAIEGEQLNVGSVRSSLARRLGINDAGPTNARSEGLAALMLDATQGYSRPLTLQRLFSWHHWLFPENNDLLAKPLLVGQLRDDAPMQIISGRIDKPTVHFEAPPRSGLEDELERFLHWFSESRHATGLDPLIRAGIAHFWFVTLHPFDDGNGRLTRAITDLALAQGERQAIRFYAMSASILEDRAGYYRVLESSQKGDVDITEWLGWFLDTLLRSLDQALLRVDRVLIKARFWHAHRADNLLPEQVKVLNRLMDGGPRGFEDGISAAQYQAVAKVSKATATRHLADLLEKACLTRLPGGGRSTRYQINVQGISSN
ncbi:Fic family protein [Pseudomonas sp. PSKL.D1]|uniref:Fic family protein n=1 Tax=Pseudomonas sp. PSKL.D1 TaxID=3029060 RepID=UPI0023813E21|nr:Fic family protein [Pseudomonas sp. PSKL.D1]WDY59002.1 Fic family protein [Pseudomonas sp. PSKL.D1]